jgi:hypothetical protein
MTRYLGPVSVPITRATQLSDAVAKITLVADIDQTATTAFDVFRRRRYRDTATNVICVKLLIF